jgi:hypothetical protein
MGRKHISDIEIYGGLLESSPFPGRILCIGDLDRERENGKQRKRRPEKNEM